MKKIVIIGSGLSGLSVASYLNTNKYDVRIFEKESYPGGRVHSELVDKNICDVGFQVLLNNYDELKALKIYDKLNLKYFDSGAQIFTEGKIISIYNPIKHPFKFLKSNILNIFTISDILSLIKSLFLKPISKKANDFIDVNFSNNAQKLFFYPFFRGVFLSKDLDTDNKFFLKIFKKFAFGSASLPKQGMKTLPIEIIKKYQLNVTYDHELKEIKSNQIIFKNGNKATFDELVLAIPLKQIKNFLDIDLNPSYNYNKTIYLKSSKNVLNKSILLVADDNFKTNSIQCLSNVSEDYSSNNDSLYSISTLDKTVTDEQLLEEFLSITKLSKNNANIIKSYSLKEALPYKSETLSNKDSIHLCGDWNCEPSIDGAIKSGRLCAHKINES